MAGIAKIAPFEISVAGYPEKHPESPTVEDDLDNLKAKVDAGASRVITQFFFDNERFLRFVEKARARGIWCPIVPGIVPIHNFKQVAGFAMKTGASIPAWLARRFDGLDDDRFKMQRDHRIVLDDEDTAASQPDLRPTGFDF